LKWLAALKDRFATWLPFTRIAAIDTPTIKTKTTKHSLAPTVIQRDEHSISRKNISEGALKVMSRLRGAGFQGFLVGGSVRDLLLGKRPKDFDIATDALPEQVRELFRSSRIIGRRFKIVHVRFGPEIIEVTTFRGRHNASGADDGETSLKQAHSARNESGMLLRDNVYGTLEEDAERRDFTVNSLYYTTENFAVYDFANGLADLKNRTIRIIGDAETRYREDPVRMLRAVRFAAKLNFAIEPGTATPIPKLANILRDVSPARMFDEVLKLLMAGAGTDTLALMQDFGLFDALFPDSAKAIAEEPAGAELLRLALRNTDQRIQQQKPVTPAFLYAALLWPALQRRFKQMQDEGVSEQLALQQAATTVIERQLQTIAIPRRFTLPMREIWEIQWRLPRRSAQRVTNLLENPRLRAGYDFLLLREEAGEALEGLGSWWTEFMAADEGHRERLLRDVNSRSASPGSGPRRRRGGRSRRPDRPAEPQADA
jgi:poly(A) polymerase